MGSGPGSHSPNVLYREAEEIKENRKQDMGYWEYIPDSQEITEQWKAGALDPEVQQHILRREAEVKRAAQTAAFERVMLPAPFAPLPTPEWGPRFTPRAKTDLLKDTAFFEKKEPVVVPPVVRVRYPRVKVHGDLFSGRRANYRTEGKYLSFEEYSITCPVCDGHMKGTMDGAECRVCADRINYGGCDGME